MTHYSVENVREGEELYGMLRSEAVRASESWGDGICHTGEERRHGRRVGVRFIVIISHVK